MGIIGAVIGFILGYFLFAEDLTLKQVVFGADTGVKLFNDIGNSIMENERLKVLITTLVGFFGGILIPIIKGK